MEVIDEPPEGLKNVTEPLKEPAIDMEEIADHIAEREAKMRRDIYMNLLMGLKIDTKMPGHKSVVRVLKEVVLGHKNVIGEDEL